MKALFTSLFVLGTLFCNAQANLYNKLNSYLTNQTKEVAVNRLIAINVWSATDKNSRNLNTEFEKAYNTFEYAKLKGGNNGIIVLNICLDNDVVNSDIVAKKDGLTKTVAISPDNAAILQELQGKNAGYNVVFDANGNKVYENLAPGTVYNSIQQLITR